MSIPGLGLAAQPARLQATTFSTAVTVHDLKPNSEWRFEVAIGESIDLKVDMYNVFKNNTNICRYCLGLLSFLEQS